MESGNVNYSGVSPRLCEPPTKMYSMIRKKKNMMTSMSSLFLCGTVFVEVWLVDVGIAEENPEPVNDPVGVVWTVDQMYFMTCRKIW